MHRSAAARAQVTGTPVRDAVLAYREVPYVAPEPVGRFLLLVFGGSQGAHFFSEILPQTLPLLSSPFRWRLTVVQQAREEDLDALRAAYQEAGIAAHLATFFRDLPERSPRPIWSSPGRPRPCRAMASATLPAGAAAARPLTTISSKCNQAGGRPAAVVVKQSDYAERLAAD